MIFSAFDHSDTDLRTARVVQRPPGALSGEAFTDSCVQCGDCVAVCPAQVIQMDPAGFPAIIDTGGCGNCGLCADVCTHGSIQFTDLTRAGLDRVLAEERKLVCV